MYKEIHRRICSISDVKKGPFGQKVNVVSVLPGPLKKRPHSQQAINCEICFHILKCWIARNNNEIRAILPAFLLMPRLKCEANTTDI